MCYLRASQEVFCQTLQVVTEIEIKSLNMIRRKRCKLCVLGQWTPAIVFFILRKKSSFSKFCSHMSWRETVSKAEFERTFFNWICKQYLCIRSVCLYHFILQRNTKRLLSIWRKKICIRFRQESRRLVNQHEFYWEYLEAVLSSTLHVTGDCRVLWKKKWIFSFDNDI